MINKTRTEFGKLGAVNVTVIESEAVDVYAKYPSSQAVVCANGSTNYQNGPDFSDDGAACAVTFIDA